MTKEAVERIKNADVKEGDDPVKKSEFVARVETAADKNAAKETTSQDQGKKQ